MGMRVEGQAQPCQHGATPTTCQACITDARGDRSEATVTAGPSPGPAADPHLAAVPSYPLGAIPDPLASLVRDGTRTGLPAAYVAAGGLAALAYCAADCSIEVGQTWVERPSLWIPAIGGSSTDKSPGVSYAWRPIQAHERQQRELFDIERDLLRQARSDGSATASQLRAAKPANPCRLISDITPEALMRRLVAGPKTYRVDELRFWLGSLGRYGAGSSSVARELGLFLALWDGTPITYDRVGDDISFAVDEPVLSIVGTLQTDQVRLLGDVASGFRARWLPHLGPARMVTTTIPDDTTPTGFYTAVNRLLDEPPKSRLLLGTDTRRVWELARKRWRDASIDAPPGVSAALVKADRQPLRVALALACPLIRASDPPPVVPAEAMAGAIAIVDYAVGCWRAVPEGNPLALSRRAELLAEPVDILASWLEGRPDGHATRRQIQQSMVAGARTSDSVDALLREYERTYPGSVVEERLGTRGPSATVVHAPKRGDLV